MNKEEQRIQLLADQLQSFLTITDSFVSELSDDDYEILKKARETLLANINIKQSAATLAMAFGIEQDTLDEKYKAKTIDNLISLFKTRKEYRTELIKKAKSDKLKEQNRKEIMKLFGSM